MVRKFKDGDIVTLKGYDSIAYQDRSTNAMYRAVLSKRLPLVVEEYITPGRYSCYHPSLDNPLVAKTGNIEKILSGHSELYKAFKEGTIPDDIYLVALVALKGKE